MEEVAHLKEFDSRTLRRDFGGARPFSHIVMDNFLDAEFFEKLREIVIDLEFEKKFSDLFSFSQTKDFVGIEEKSITKFYEFISSKEFLGFVEDITGLGSFSVVDMAATIYSQGNYLLPHDDTVENRKLAYMLYFEDFDEDEGGELALYDSLHGSPKNIEKTIFPKRNRLVIFEVGNSEAVSFHEVKEVVASKRRLTVGGWLG